MLPPRATLDPRMPGSHWMIALAPADYAVTRSHGHTLLGLRARHRKKAERMSQGDRILYYVLERRAFPATAIVTSAYFEDHQPVWTGRDGAGDLFPFRVHTQPGVVLEPEEVVDAALLAPRLMYLKRWPMEYWYLGLQGDVHLLSAQDFQLIEREMRRIVEARPRTAPPPPAPPGRRPAARDPRTPLLRV